MVSVNVQLVSVNLRLSVQNSSCDVETTTARSSASFTLRELEASTSVLEAHVVVHARDAMRSVFVHDN